MAGKYQPSNHTEGDAFMTKWCGECKRMAGYFGDIDEDLCRGEAPCEILGAAFSRSLRSPQYPKEWTFSDDGTPICTAFQEKGTPDKPVRCDATIDLFNDQQGK